MNTTRVLLALALAVITVHAMDGAHPSHAPSSPCRLPAGIDKTDSKAVRKFVLTKYADYATKILKHKGHERCVKPLNNLLRSSLSSASLDDLLFHNTSALQKVCGAAKCELSDLISVAEHALRELADDLECVLPHAGDDDEYDEYDDDHYYGSMPPSVMPEHDDDYYSSMPPSVMPEHGDDYYSSMPPSVMPEHGDDYYGSMPPSVMPEHGDDYYSSMPPSVMPEHDDEYDHDGSASGPASGSDDSDDHYYGSMPPSVMPEDDEASASGPAGGDDHDDSEDTAAPLPTHLELFRCASDCLADLDVTKIMAAGGVKGCTILQGALSSTCLEDCPRKVLGLAHELAGECRREPALLDVDLGQAMCAYGCGAKLTWETDACEWLQGDGGKCVSACGGHLEKLAAGAVGMCDAAAAAGGRHLMEETRSASGLHGEEDDKTRGASGPHGDDDKTRGASGASGPHGEEDDKTRGASGPHGDDDKTRGASGASGPHGEEDKTRGASGASGPHGDDDKTRGASGPHGDDDKTRGASGASGPRGASGPHGDDDKTRGGASGPHGDDDKTRGGASGASGPHGDGRRCLEKCKDRCRHLMVRADDAHPRCINKCRKHCAHGPRSVLKHTIRDIRSALARANDLHDVICTYDDDEHHDDSTTTTDDEEEEEVDTGLCLGHLAALDAKVLCTSGCAAKLLSHFDALLAPVFSGEGKASAVLGDFLCSRVKNEASGDAHYCVDLLQDVEAAADADKVFAGVAGLCMKDASGARPCLAAASGMAKHFDKLMGKKAERAADKLCETAAAAAGDKTRAHVETPVTAEEELTADEERALSDRVAAEIRREVAAKLGLGEADVTVVVTIRRAEVARRMRRMAVAGGVNYILTHDIVVADSTALPAADQLFTTVVAPAVAAAGLEAATYDRSTATTSTVRAAAFSFEGQDISKTADAGDEEEAGEGRSGGKKKAFLFGYSKQTVFVAGGVAGGVVALAVVALTVRRRRRRQSPRDAARRQSRRLDDDGGEPAAPVVTTKIDLYDKA